MNTCTLQNGLTCSMAHDPSAKTVTATMFFKVGSICEPEGLWGGSHLLEHLFFDGTSEYPSAVELATEFDRLAAKANAYTSKDSTAYYIESLPNHLHESLALLSQIVFDSYMRQESMDKEKIVILNELRTANADDMKVASALAEEYLCRGTPYEHDLGGLEISLELKPNINKTQNKSPNKTQNKSAPLVASNFVQEEKHYFEDIKREDLMAYLSYFYQPANAILMINGNILNYDAIKACVNDPSLKQNMCQCEAIIPDIQQLFGQPFTFLYSTSLVPPALFEQAKSKWYPIFKNLQQQIQATKLQGGFQYIYFPKVVYREVDAFPSSPLQTTSVPPSRLISSAKKQQNAFRMRGDSALSMGALAASYSQAVKTEQSSVSIQFACTTNTDPAHYAVDVLATLLGGMQSALLTTVLRETYALVYTTRANVEYYDYFGIFEIVFLSSEAVCFKALRLVFDEIAALLKNIGDRIDQDKLDIGKNYTIANLAYSRQNNNSVASSSNSISNSISNPVQNPAKDWDPSASYAQITLDDVQKAIRDIFHMDACSIAVVAETKPTAPILSPDQQTKLVAQMFQAALTGQKDVEDLMENQLTSQTLKS